MCALFPSVLLATTRFDFTKDKASKGLYLTTHYLEL